jgi:alpha-mannosidase
VVDLKGDSIDEVLGTPQANGKLLTHLTVPQFGFITLRLIDFNMVVNPKNL